MELKYGFEIHCIDVSNVNGARLGTAVKLFPLNLNHVRLDRLDITSGTPVRLLLPKFRYCKLRMADISDGMVPSSPLEVMAIHLKDTSADIVEDRLDSLLLSSQRNVSAERPDQSITPEIALRCRSKYCS